MWKQERLWQGFDVGRAVHRELHQNKTDTHSLRACCSTASMLERDMKPTMRISDSKVTAESCGMQQRVQGSDGIVEQR